MKGEDGGRARLVLLLPLLNPELEEAGEDEEDVEFETVSLFGSLVNACFSPHCCFSSIL